MMGLQTRHGHFPGGHLYLPVLPSLLFSETESSKIPVCSPSLFRVQWRPGLFPSPPYKTAKVHLEDMASTHTTTPPLFRTPQSTAFVRLLL